MTKRSKRRIFILYLQIGGMLLAPLVLLALPASFFDQGQSLCISVLLLDQTCPACGSTRSIMHLIHLDFLTAWEYNKIAVLVFPVLAYVYLDTLLRSFRRLKKWRLSATE